MISFSGAIAQSVQMDMVSYAVSMDVAEGGFHAEICPYNMQMFGLSGSTGEVTFDANKNYYFTSGVAQPVPAWGNRGIRITDISDALLNELTLYPLPASDHLTLTWNYLYQHNCRIIIYDLEGKLVMQTPFISQIALSAFERGKYVLTIISDSGEVLEKRSFIKL